MTKFQDAITHLVRETPHGPTFELPRTVVTFEVDPETCHPGAFRESFKLTLQSVTPAIESQAEARAMRALGVGKSGAAVDPTAMLIRTQRELAFLSVTAFNGEKLGDAEREMLWGLLGEGGRMLVMKMFSENLQTHLSDDAAGKAQGSLEVG